MKKLSLLKVVRFTAAFLLMQAAFESFSQEHRFAHIDARHGLSHGHIKSIYRDQTGFLWIGTESGLNRFDGYSITTFRNEPSDSTSLFYDDISRLFKMPGEKMGVATSVGLCLYDPSTETFSRNLQPLRSYSISEPDNLRCAVHDSSGNYWFLVEGEGLICYNEKSGKIIAAKHLDEDTTTIASNNVMSFAQHADGSYWIAHSNGLVENVVPGEHRMTVVRRLTYFYDRLPNKDQYLVLELTADRDGNLWIYPTNVDLGLCYFNPHEDRIHHLGKNSNKARLSSDMITSVVEDNFGEIWIATGHDGIDILNKKSFSVRNMSYRAENSTALSENSIPTMFKDYDGVIWVGTYKKGLNYFHENIMRFPLVNRYSKPYELPYEDINRFVEDKAGNLWLGTNGGGLIYFNRQSGKFTTYRHDPENPQSLSNDVIVSLHLDHEGKLWIGTFLGGLNCFDGRKFIRYQHDPENAKSLSGRSVWEITEDSQQRLWIGTLDGGVNLFDRKTKTFTRFFHPDQRSLYSPYISTIFEDADGNVWFGTSIGLDVLMKTSGKIVHFETEEGNTASLGNNGILGIFEDSKGRIWIGTRGGLSLWHRESNRFTNYTLKDGLPHNTILSMLEDEDGQLWLGTPNGLSCASISTEGERFDLSFRNYSETDGLQGWQFNEDAAIRTNRGELVFGGANGFNIFRPSDIGQNKVMPRLAFTAFQLFNRTVRPGRAADGEFTLPSSITMNPAIELKASDNVFSIEFAALNFIQPYKNEYRYKLEGFNKDWLSADAINRRVTFTNLDAGDYVFRVIASNNDGVWNEEGVSLHIKVHPPFWKSAKAYVLYMLIVFALLLITRRLIQQSEKLKFAVRQQQEDAMRSRELDIMKTKFFTNVSHELRTPLSLIISPLEQLRSQAVSSEQRRHFDLIQRNAKRLLNLVNQLLDFRKLEVHNIRFRPSEGDIIRFVRETVSSFSDLSEKKDIRLTFESNVSSLEAIFDHDKIEKILFNLLSNAFKFTMGNGQIAVMLEAKDSGQNSIVEIRVKDTGIGIPPEKHDLIFERFFQNDLSNSVMNQGSGIGLAITKEFVRIHGGTIHVDSEVDKGACFTVVLPLKRLVQSVHETIAEPVQTITIDRENEIESASKDKPTVLLVEDSEDFRFYLKDNLKISYNVIEAADGEEGWNKALSQHPDLIVSDIMMPGMNGLQLCKELKSDDRVSHIPVILLTARSGDEQRLEGFEVGADDYIPKPFNFQVLEFRIRNLISLRQNLHNLFSKKNVITASEIQVTSLDEEFVHRFIQAIEQNIGNADLTVVDLSRQLGVSRAKFFKKVQAITGKSPLEVIRMIRLQHAAQLLEKSQLSVSEIAYKVGFNNPKYFARHFKETYHVLPSAYASGKRSD